MQIPLNIQLPAIATFDSFVAGENVLLPGLLQQAAREQGEAQIYCWSETGLGKTHLLQAACRFAVEQKRRAAYLPLLQLSQHPPVMLENLEFMHLICVDDVHAIAGKSDWEHALFSLINRCRAHSCRLAFAATRNIPDLGLQLADLTSRLAWGPVFQLRPLSDAGKLRVLQQRAQARGMELPESTGQYLLTHYRRELRLLCEQLDALDHASLVEQRKLTIPFIKSVLSLP
ncbi:MAG TPA: DnaA regulatory inactivator Hda [Gammaproteobacteria bacterium]